MYISCRIRSDFGRRNMRIRSNIRIYRSEERPSVCAIFLIEHTARRSAGCLVAVDLDDLVRNRFSALEFDLA